MANKRNDAVSKPKLPAKKDVKNKKGKRIALIVTISVIALFLVFLIVAWSAGLIGGYRKIKSTELEATVVGECNGYEVRYEELRYIASIYQKTIERKYGEGAWEDEKNAEKYEKELEAYVLSNIKNNYVIYTLYERFFGDDFDSKEIREFVDTGMKEMIKEDFGGSMKEYKEFLAENKLSDSLLRLVYKTDYMESAVLNALINDPDLGYVLYSEKNIDEFSDYVLEDDDYARTIHVFYPDDFGDAEESAEIYEKVENIASELQAISDSEERYKKMCSEIGRAPYENGFSIMGTDGVYFTSGQMGEEYEEAAFALGDDNDVSGVVTTDDGYYVIMRMPKEEDYVMRKLFELLSYYQNAKLNVLEQITKENIEFLPNDFYRGLVLSEIE